jgi:hypothetical protein
MTNQKVERWCQALADKFTAIFGSTYTITKAYDASSDLYIKVQVGAGPNNIVHAIVRIKPDAAPASGAYDSLGLAQTVFCPHVAEVMFDITTPFSAGATEAERAVICQQVMALGTKVKMYSYAVGSGNIAVTDFASNATLRATLNNVEGSFGAMANL